MFLVIFGIVVLVVMIAILCLIIWLLTEKNRKKGLIPALVFVAILFTASGTIFLVIGTNKTLMGYPAPKSMLGKNSVYEVVTSFKDKDQSYAVVHEPNGSIRLFYTDQTLEKGFFKAIVPDGKSGNGIILVPLITHTVHVEFVLPEELAPNPAAIQQPK